MRDDQGRRFLIATGTTRHPHRPDLGDRPELAAEIGAIRSLFTANGTGARRDEIAYQEVPSFGPDLTGGELKTRLRAFATAKQRSSDDYLIFYYTAHGEVDDSGEFVLPFPDTTDDLVGTAVPASELARWLLIGTPLQRLLIILDTCYAGTAGSELAARATAALGRLRARRTGPSSPSSPPPVPVSRPTPAPSHRRWRERFGTAPPAVTNRAISRWTLWWTSSTPTRVAPDYYLLQTAADLSAGRDPALDKAVALLHR